ncbi:P-loop containing nucleoside triphosphate hydrolase protein [Mycena leptocephala]|nr:P-loop containing nucleoside triphosphate hydrolase protein [Mycena leptocephala]
MNGTKNINEDASSNSSIQVEQLGVWRVFLEKEATWFDLRALWHRWEIAFPTVKKLTIDFHILAPILFPLLCLATLFSQVAPVIMWHLFNRSLFLIEAGLTHGQFDRAAIAYTVGARVAFAALVAMISWWSRKAEFLVQTRIVQHFEGILFEWRSKVDLCKSEDNPKNEQEELINAHTVCFEKGHEISGGERQRVAASRTFMRLTSGTVKLIIADEPSSNLDPQGEWELFKNLMDERQGKTVVFVTHRFGHLTKQADLILCMKNGRLVEQGTHDELMALEGDHGERGEYFKLYEIQARAFT